jgi:hypothetical protein
MGETVVMLYSITTSSTQYINTHTLSRLRTWTIPIVARIRSQAIVTKRMSTGRQRDGSHVQARTQTARCRVFQIL